ncbi:glycosyltransferase family 9 protein [Halobacteriovorax sp.]|uniref:glycosyltransferase family 9 protein n=1 Tax=Halobacteriovorax sp. TaxID=2020862 RepID=UPI003567F8C1
MKKILLINLRRFGDIYSSAHLINSMVQSGNYDVSILVYKEFEKAALNIEGVSNIYTIDRKRIITLTKSEIFNNGYALEEFNKDLSTVTTQDWDEVINFSNERVSTHITSLLSSNRKIGLEFTSEMKNAYSSDWEMLLNDVITELDFSPMHFNDIYHQMVGVDTSKNSLKLKTSTNHNENAFKNINFLRQAEKGKNKKIVGIQLFTSEESKNIPEKTIIEVIENLHSKDIVTMLLIAPTEDEKERAAKINDHFEGRLVTVESDFHALTSVVINLDCLITPDTAIKHLSDLVETPCLEVSLGASPFLKQGSINEQSLILSKTIEDRDFSNKDTNTDLRSDDIVNSTLLLMGLKSFNSTHIGEGYTLYRPYKDSLGTSYFAVKGEVNSELEVQRIASRMYISKTLLESNDDSFSEMILELKGENFKRWISNEKEAVTRTTKDLLGAIRSLIQIGEGANQSKNFINSLGHLMAHCEDSTITSIPSLFLRARLESAPTMALEDSVKDVEKNLYKMKNELQKVYEVLKTIEDNSRKHEADTVIENMVSNRVHQETL